MTNIDSSNRVTNIIRTLVFHITILFLFLYYMSLVAFQFLGYK